MKVYHKHENIFELNLLLSIMITHPVMIFFIQQHSNEDCEDTICNLTHQDNQASIEIVQMDDIVIEQQQVGEPHWGT